MFILVMLIKIGPYITINKISISHQTDCFIGLRLLIAIIIIIILIMKFRQ